MVILKNAVIESKFAGETVISLEPDRAGGKVIAKTPSHEIWLYKDGTAEVLHERDVQAALPDKAKYDATGTLEMTTRSLEPNEQGAEIWLHFKHLEPELRILRNDQEVEAALSKLQ